MSDTAYKIKVMQAFEDGESIQIGDPESDYWKDWVANSEPQWNWVHIDYRIKPKPRRFWVPERLVKEPIQKEDWGYRPEKLILVEEVLNDE